MTVKQGVQKKLQLIKQGFKSYVTPVRIPLSAESKWTLEIVCLNQPPATLPESPSITQKARAYIQNQLFQTQTEIDKNKQDWINTLKN